MQVSRRIVVASTISRPGDLAAILTNLKKRDVLGIEEVHTLVNSLVAVLALAMEHRQLDITIGNGEQLKHVRFNLPWFTIVASTTRPRLVPYQLHKLFKSKYEVET